MWWPPNYNSHVHESRCPSPGQVLVASVTCAQSPERNNPAREKAQVVHANLCSCICEYESTICIIYFLFWAPSLWSFSHSQWALRGLYPRGICPHGFLLSWPSSRSPCPAGSGSVKPNQEHSHLFARLPRTGTREANASREQARRVHEGSRWCAY